MWMLSGGGSYTDSIGKYTIDSPENVKTFEWLQKNLVGKGLTGTDPAELNREDAFQGFADGEVGMLNGHPTLMKQAAAKGIDYGTVDLPGVNGKAKATMGVADWMMAFKQNGHREEAGKFLDFVYSDKNVDEVLRRVRPAAGHHLRLPGDAGRRQVHHAAQLPQAARPTPSSTPSNKTSWPLVSKTVKAKMGAAVGPGATPRVLTDIAERRGHGRQHRRVTVPIGRGAGTRALADLRRHRGDGAGRSERATSGAG